MKALKVKDLYEACKIEIKKGNANKTIMISSDDEGNSYHYLWYQFSTIKAMEEPVVLPSGEVIECPFEFIDENIAKKEDTIILG